MKLHRLIKVKCSKAPNRVGIRNSKDYSPFGVELDGRTVSLEGYRFGFNGKENLNEISGDGNEYDFGARIFNPRLGRWLSTDPLSVKQPDQSTFKAFLNCPLVFIDPDGKDEFERIIIYNEKGQVVLTAEKLIKKNRYISDGIIYFHDTYVPELSNGFNYYSKTTKITINNSGYVTKKSEDNQKVIKYQDGIQDREGFLGAEKKGAIYETIELDFGANGNTQNGGWNLTSDGGGVNQTKAKAKNPVGSVDIGLLLNTLGNLKYVKVGNKVPEIIISYVRISGKVMEVNINKEKPQFIVKVINWEKYDGNGYRGPFKIYKLNSKEEVLKKYPDAKQIGEKYFTVERGIKSARQN